jgi:hypothetical protein
MRATEAIVLAVVTIICAACASTLPTVKSGTRSISLDDTKYSEEKLGKFNSWRCRDYVHDTGTLVEVGTFTMASLSKFGFVLYDGGNTGTFTVYQREGLNHRWDWGSEGHFSFIIKPDGTGLYYDFSSVPSGETAKAKDVYKCAQ